MLTDQDPESRFRLPAPTTELQTAIGGPNDKGQCAPGTRKMDARLEDATQVCSGYCSVGRYLVRWELDAMMAYFWSLELHLSDLGLTPEEEATVRRTLACGAGRPAGGRGQGAAAQPLPAAGGATRSAACRPSRPAAGPVTVGACSD